MQFKSCITYLDLKAQFDVNLKVFKFLHNLIYSVKSPRARYY